MNCDLCGDALDWGDMHFPANPNHPSQHLHLDGKCADIVKNESLCRRIIAGLMCKLPAGHEGIHREAAE